MFAKRFFFVCAGLLCLAIAYHLGARNAGAQAGGTLEGAEIQLWPGSIYSFIASGVVGREFYYMDPDGSLHTFSAPIPGTARVVASLPSRGVVILENSDMLQFTGTEWNLIGSLVGGPTPVKPETWGELKARYRTGR